MSLEVLAALEKRVTDHTREKHTWKFPAAGDLARPFGGRNLILAGDFWQFPAVKATSMFTNPFVSHGSVLVRNMQKLVWTHAPRSINHLFELSKEQRCQGPWLSHVLRHARHGTMPQETWAFLRGLPTCNPGSWNPVTQECECGKCDALSSVVARAPIPGSAALGNTAPSRMHSLRNRAHPPVHSPRCPAHRLPRRSFCPRPQRCEIRRRGAPRPI